MAQGGDVFQRKLAPGLSKLLGPQVSNRFGGWRREIYLSVLSVAVFLLAYWILSRVIFELRAFFSEHWRWFMGVGVAALIVFSSLCLLDRKLREWAQFVFIVMGFFFVIVFAWWRYYQGVVERDLP